MSDRNLLPLPDAPLLAAAARRTAWTRRLVAAVLVASLAACAVLALVDSDAAGSRARGRPTVIVLDVSGSIGSEASRRVNRLFASVASRSRDGAGLVLFSDTGYVALPPGSRPAALLAYTRYFISPKARSYPPPLSAGSSLTPPTLAAETPPWAGFSGGTSISTGLATARLALARAHVHSADVVLASDFFDDGMDDSRLRRELEIYARTPAIRLWTVPLPAASTTGLAVFHRYLPASVRPYRPPERRPGSSPPGSSGASVPLRPAFLIAACVLMAALAALGLVDKPFSWGDGS